jgi:hypothetical protein
MKNKWGPKMHSNQVLCVMCEVRLPSILNRKVCGQLGNYGYGLLSRQ